MRLVVLIALFFSVPAHAASARLITDMGTIMIELDTEKTPKTAKHFMGLATGELRYTDLTGKKVNKPFYNDLIFHRVNPALGIFTGCPWGDGRGWPGFLVPEESPEGSKFDRAGLVAMAKRPGSDQIGSQFFITTAASPHLNDRYTIFGTVTSGLDIVKKIAGAPRNNRDKPLKPIHLKAIEIVK